MYYLFNFVSTIFILLIYLFVLTRAY